MKYGKEPNENLLANDVVLQIMLFCLSK